MSNCSIAAAAISRRCNTNSVNHVLPESASLKRLAARFVGKALLSDGIPSFYYFYPITVLPIDRSIIWLFFLLRLLDKLKYYNAAISSKNIYCLFHRPNDWLYSLHRQPPKVIESRVAYREKKNRASSWTFKKARTRRANNKSLGSRSRPRAATWPSAFANYFTSVSRSSAQEQGAREKGK